jgi:FkbM family methyltransferase
MSDMSTENQTMQMSPAAGLLGKINAIATRILGLRQRWAAAAHNPDFPAGTKIGFRYRLRRLVAPRFLPPCYVGSRAGAKHYLSSDPVDDLVLKDVLGVLRDLYFPSLTENDVSELRRIGWILDVGAYGGSWTTEMLMQYPDVQAVAIEPNHQKCENILRTLRASGIAGRVRIVEAGLSGNDGSGCLMESPDGSWGNWVQSETPGTPDGQQGAHRQIATVSLSKALAGVKPAVVKCNAEGAEFELVKQLLDLGLRPVLIILMVHPEHGDMEAMRNSLIQAGYRVDLAYDWPTRPAWHVRLSPQSATGK